MHKTTFLFQLRVAFAAVVAAVGILLISEPASAVPARGTLGTTTFEPTGGIDLTIASTHTSGGCTAGGNAVFTDVVGPVGATTPVFPPEQPFNITTATSAIFSSTHPMDIPWDGSMADAARLVGKPLAPGEYDVTTHCVDAITLQDFGTFTGSLTFTDATHYTAARGGTSSAPPSSSAPTSIPSTDSDSTTTAPTTNPGDTAGTTSAPSDALEGTQPASSNGTSASTGAPIALLFLGGLLLVAGGLILIVWLQRRRKMSSSGNRNVGGDGQS